MNIYGGQSFNHNGVGNFYICLAKVIRACIRFKVGRRQVFTVPDIKETYHELYGPVVFKYERFAVCSLGIPGKPYSFQTF
jgi:hypothetical protein